MQNERQKEDCDSHDLRAATLRTPCRFGSLRLESGHSWEAIPKGFRLKAQGCEARATLGKKGEKGINPNGVAAAENLSDATPLGLDQAWRRCPRGRRGAPTLGFGTESRWDSRLDARPRRCYCSHPLL